MIRTRVGYAGGTKVDPTYRQMGDHTETIEIDYDPSMTDLKELLDLFWMHHNAMKTSSYRGRQYMSLLLYRNELQKEKAYQLKQKWEKDLNGKIQTEISPYKAFYLAEDKHQKYYLKRFQKAYKTVMDCFPTHQEVIDSTLVARLNGFVREFGSLHDVRKDVETWGLSENDCKSVMTIINSLKW